MAEDKATEKSDVTATPEVKAPKAAAPRKTAAKATATKAQAAGEPADAAQAEAPKAKAPRAKAPKVAAKAETSKATGPEGHGGTLRVHHLRPAPGSHTPKTRVGRGQGSKGKTAGRGTKGTKARYQVPVAFEGGQMPMHMRLPKLRGFRNPFRVEYQVVNLDRLSALYPDGGDVTVPDLVAKGAVRKGLPVKVLGTGEVSVKLAVEVDALSTSAKDKILAAGGSVANG
jgi:large subunit ribosomal protein L15